MATQNQALLGIFQGGQMTDLPAFPTSLDLTALLEIVSPGNAALGVNYSITLAQLALLVGGGSSPTIIISGATYPSVATDTRILVNKTVGSATAITLLSAQSYFQPVLIKDIKLDADVNPITINFTGTYDGVASPLTINTQGGWIWFNPLASGNWYDANP
jgi:hypothetical protein